MLKVRSDVLWCKWKSTRFLEHNCHNVISNVSLPQKLQKKKRNNEVFREKMFVPHYQDPHTVNTWLTMYIYIVVLLRYSLTNLNLQMELHYLLSVVGCPRQKRWYMKHNFTSMKLCVHWILPSGVICPTKIEKN